MLSTGGDFMLLDGLINPNKTLEILSEEGLLIRLATALEITEEELKEKILQDDGNGFNLEGLYIIYQMFRDGDFRILFPEND